MGASNPDSGLNPQVSQATTLSLSGPTNITWSAFADGDATPDVSAGTAFVTANTGATSITDFDGETNAMIIVQAGDNNTTIVHDATKIVLRGGLSVPLTQNDVMIFVNRAGIWYETPFR